MPHSLTLTHSASQATAPPDMESEKFVFSGSFQNKPMITGALKVHPVLRIIKCLANEKVRCGFLKRRRGSTV